MTYGTTTDMAWQETLPAGRGAAFTGRTFCRIHIAGGAGLPSVGEIWASPDHAVEGHAHESDEMLYVLRGAIQVNERRLAANEVAFIPGGSAYEARVLSRDGAHVLRIVIPAADARARSGEPEYGSKPWSGPLTEEGYPDLSWTGS